MAVELPEFFGHKIRQRVRRRDCSSPARMCCPHYSVVVEVEFPSGRKRELWGEPPNRERRGHPRTREVVVPEKPDRRKRHEEPLYVEPNED